MGYIIVYLIVIVLVFIILRELVMWYWKINQRVDLLTKIADSLTKIETALDFLATDTDRKNDDGISKVETIADIKVSDTTFEEPKFQTSKVKGENK